MDKPWKVVLAFLGVFIAGAVFGGFFSLGLGRKIWEMEALPAKPATPATTATASTTPAAPNVARPAPQPQQFLPEPQAVQSAQLLRRVTNQLNLTATQKTQITPIIQRAVQDFWRQQQNFSRENAFLLQRLKQDIAKELTPEQQTRLDDLWLKQLDLFRKKQADAQAQARAVAQPPQTQTTAKPASDEKAATPESTGKPATPAATPKPPGSN
jgi:hypothetical protein